jgi:molybdate transport system substrate-binding protein
MRRGSIHGPALTAICSSVVLLVLGGLLWMTGRQHGSITASKPLLVYCAGGLKGPLEAIRPQYEREFGQRLEIQYGGSNTLLANLQVTGRGDVFLPADESYLEIALREGLVRQAVPIATMRPIVAVWKGNPRQIWSLGDLTSGRVRISMTEPEAAATGKLVRDALRKLGCWEAFRARVTVFKPTVHDVANDLKLGAVDAGVIWDALLIAYPDFEEVALPELQGLEARVVAGVAAGSQQPAAALALVNYLASPGTGQDSFQLHGFGAASRAQVTAEEQP